MPFEPLTALGIALRLALLFLWQSARIAMPGAPPPTARDAWRIARGRARLSLLVDRIDRLALRWLNGTLPKPRPGRSRPTRPQPAPPSASPTAAEAPLPPSRQRDPSGRAWLARAFPPAGQAGEVLGHMLATRRDIRALVAAAPQAARLLRPLARMLGAPLPDWLRLPQPRPRPPRPAKSRRSRSLYAGLKDPTLKWRPWELRAVRAALRKYGRT